MKVVPARLNLVVFIYILLVCVLFLALQALVL